MRYSRETKRLGWVLILLLAACGGGDGGSAQLTFSPNAPPPPSGETGTVYPAFTFAPPTGGLGPFTWSETGALPPGMSLSPSGRLSGTPVTAGTFPFTLTVTDSSSPHLAAMESVTLLIKDSPLVINTTPAPPSGSQSLPYAGFVFTATGGSAPMTWRVTSGALPSGLTLASNGALSGYPAVVGSATFTVTVTDSSPTPESDSKVFTIGVHPPAPTINGPPPPTGTVGVPYLPANAPFTFTASGGTPPLVWSETGNLPPGMAFSASGILSGTPSEAGQFPITVTVKDALNLTNSAPFIIRVSLARPPMGFTPALGTMTKARNGHSATLLLDGTVLVAGGPDSSAELYDPTTQKFTATNGVMSETRSGHSATLLANAALKNYARVLIAGNGGDQSGLDTTAELYDPVTQTFMPTGSMDMPRPGHTATLLANATSPNAGKVLVTGGNSLGDNCPHDTATAELYDPQTGVFTATGSMTVRRAYHTATLLLDGRVLIVGAAIDANCDSLAPSAELYDQVSGTFTATGSPSKAPVTATLLTDGTVLIVGVGGTAELYTPATGSFTPVGAVPLPSSTTSPPYTLLGSTASLRQDGTAVIAGGCNVDCARPDILYPAKTSFGGAELYAPESGGFTVVGSLNTPRDGHTATVLLDGTVLVAGGTNHKWVVTGDRGQEIATVLSSAELFK